MARIAGVDIPREKRLGTSLTYIPVLIIGLFLGGLEWKKAVILIVAGNRTWPPTRSNGISFQAMRALTFAPCFRRA